MGLAGQLLVMLAVAAPRGGERAAGPHTEIKTKVTVSSTCAPAKLAPLRARKPTPAQRVMPDLH